jgi:hypothetical protein
LPNEKRFLKLKESERWRERESGSSSLHTLIINERDASLKRCKTEDFSKKMNRE